MGSIFFTNEVDCDSASHNLHSENRRSKELLVQRSRALGHVYLTVKPVEFCVYANDIHCTWIHSYTILKTRVFFLKILFFQSSYHIFY